MKSRRCAKPTIELVQTWPSLTLKFKEMAAYQQKLFVLVSPSFGNSKQGLVQFGPTQVWVWHILYFSSSPPRFWVLGFAASVYFLSVETVLQIWIHLSHKEAIILTWTTNDSFDGNKHLLEDYRHQTWVNKKTCERGYPDTQYCPFFLRHSTLEVKGFGKTLAR